MTTRPEIYANMLERTITLLVEILLTHFGTKLSAKLLLIIAVARRCVLDRRRLARVFFILRQFVREEKNGCK
jgi:hypothetical protein